MAPARGRGAGCGAAASPGGRAAGGHGTGVAAAGLSGGATVPDPSGRRWMRVLLLPAGPQRPLGAGAKAPAALLVLLPPLLQSLNG